MNILLPLPDRYLNPLNRIDSGIPSHLHDIPGNGIMIGTGDEFESISFSFIDRLGWAIYPIRFRSVEMTVEEWFHK